MLDPAAPNVKKGSRSAARSRAVNRVLNYDQYVIEPVAPGVGRAHNGAMPSPGITSSESQTV